MVIGQRVASPARGRVRSCSLGFGDWGFQVSTTRSGRRPYSAKNSESTSVAVTMIEPGWRGGGIFDRSVVLVAVDVVFQENRNRASVVLPRTRVFRTRINAMSPRAEASLDLELLPSKRASSIMLTAIVS